MLNNNQRIKFSGAGASHQNGAADRSIKMIVTMERTTLMYATLRCPNDALSTDFDQCRFTMMYGSTGAYFICSIVYKLLDWFNLNISNFSTNALMLGNHETGTKPSHLIF